MKALFLASAVAILLGPLAALADDHGGKHGHGHKEEYWDGACKVERKWKHGEYTEKRKCKPVVQYQPAPVVVQPAPVIMQPAPVVVQPAPVVVQQPALVVPQPGITVQGTVHLK